MAGCSSIASASAAEQSEFSLDSCICDGKHHTMTCAGVSDPVSVAKFKADCARHLESVEAEDDDITRRVSSMPAGPMRDFGLMEMLNVSTADFEKVKEECNTDKLLPAQGIDSILKLREHNLPKDTQLLSINSPKLVKNYLLLGRGYGWETGAEQRSTRSLTDARNKEMESEVVLTVVSFNPVKKRPDLELHVLSSQTLTDLRDKIVCSCDYFISHDFSDDPDSFEAYYGSHSDPPNVSPSAFFFINNTFYIDYRHPQSNDDRVKEIIDWAKSENRTTLSPRLDHFVMAKMEDTKFEDLTFRLGYPYLYNHHGNCEHLLVFADLRLYNPSLEYPSKSDYPTVIYRQKVQHRLCSLCNFNVSKWVTEDDELAPESPCFFCKDCFKKLHYSQDNKKLCNFKAYPYKATI